MPSHPASRIITIRIDSYDAGQYLLGVLCNRTEDIHTSLREITQLVPNAVPRLVHINGQRARDDTVDVQSAGYGHKFSNQCKK